MASGSVLTAGPLQVTLEPGRLRWVRWQGIEILRGLEVTVRDSSWGTAAPTVTAQSVRRHRKLVAVHQGLKYRHRDIDLATAVDVELEVGGRLRMTFRAVARSTFERNRIGLIILHPASVAGSPAAFHTGAAWSDSRFPTVIDPGVVATDLVGMRWRPSRSLTLTLELDGERWETEDQRNWTDASFKTYPTPLRIPYPAVVTQGTIIAQSVVLTIESHRTMATQSRTPATLDLASGPSIRMPRMTAMVPIRSKRGRSDATAIRDSGIAAIRVAIDGDRGGAAERIIELTELAADAGVAVDVELTIHPADRHGVATLVEALASSRAPVPNVFVFDAESATGYDSSRAALAALATEFQRVKFGAALGGGTRANFTELNRARLEPAGMTVATYGVNPQVHAFDERSIVESLETLPVTVRQARIITGQRPLSLVVTFRPRVNAAIGRVRFADAEGGPERADPRQASAFVAAWSVGAAAGLARRGVRSLSMFETLGAAGLARTLDGLETYPVGAVVAALAELSGTTVRTASTPATVAIAGSAPFWGRILIANLRPLLQRVRIASPWAGQAQASVLAEASWRGGPDRGWVESRSMTVHQSTVFELEPWQTLRIDRLERGNGGSHSRRDR